MKFHGQDLGQKASTSEKMVRCAATAITEICIILQYACIILSREKNHPPPPPPPLMQPMQPMPPMPPPCNCPPIIELNSSIPARQFLCRGQNVNFTCTIKYHVKPGPQYSGFTPLIIWHSDEYIGQGGRIIISTNREHREGYDTINDNITTRAELIYHDQEKTIESRLYIDKYLLHSVISCSAANENFKKNIALQFLENPDIVQDAKYIVKTDGGGGCKLYLFWNSPNNIIGGDQITYNINVHGKIYVSRNNMKVISYKSGCDMIHTVITIKAINQCGSVSPTTSFEKLWEEEPITSSPCTYHPDTCTSVPSQSSNMYSTPTSSPPGNNGTCTGLVPASVILGIFVIVLIVVVFILLLCKYKQRIRKLKVSTAVQTEEMTSL